MPSSCNTERNDDWSDSISKLAERREVAVKRLIAGLEHLSLEQQYATITAWMPIDELEKLAEFQDRRE